MSVESKSNIRVGSATDQRAGKFLTFVLAKEEYGVEILKVREIIGLMPTAAVPGMPPEMVGVINLRGKVIPVIDMRLYFAMPKVDYSDETCIIVVAVHGNLIGILVDRVSEVRDIRAEDIEDAPRFGTDDGSLILGMAKSRGKVTILLNIDQVRCESETEDNITHS